QGAPFLAGFRPWYTRPSSGLSAGTWLIAIGPRSWNRDWKAPGPAMAAVAPRTTTPKVVTRRRVSRDFWGRACTLGASGVAGKGGGAGGVPGGGRRGGGGRGAGAGTGQGYRPHRAQDAGLRGGQGG